MASQYHHSYPYSDYTIKWATSQWEIDQAFALRRRVFCQEQRIFEHDDCDEVDAYAQCLIAVAGHGCWHDKVVGTVRIHDEGKHVWWGSRLAVDANFRGKAGLGSALIKLAVSSANALGCQQFLAQVQKPNEALFQRLNWQSKFDIMVRNHPHVMMQAELEKFPPNANPNVGFIVRENLNSYNQNTAPALLEQCSAFLSSVAQKSSVTNHKIGIESYIR